MLLTKENTGLNLATNLKNEFYITYRTVLMPIQITLVGFFSQVMEFTESAQDPFNRDYSFAFTVVYTSPSLDELVDRVGTSLTTLGQATLGASGGSIPDI